MVCYSNGCTSGLLLGPLFFVIFISYLPEVVIPGNCVSLYADDCKTSRIMNCPADHSLFQSDLYNLYAWSQQNLMEFNVKKCKLMHITKRKTPIHSDLHLNNNILELTSECRYLGLVTDCNLPWSTHIDKISNKANKILGLIKRTSKGFQDVSTLRPLYLALVSSQLKYCSSSLLCCFCAPLVRFLCVPCAFPLRSFGAFPLRSVCVSFALLWCVSFAFRVRSLYKNA